MTPVNLDNRLHAVWERLARFEPALYAINTDWFDATPVDAPHQLRKMAIDVFNIACELDAIAYDLEADRKSRDERVMEAGAIFAELAARVAEANAEMERDKCTQRLGEIARTPHTRKDANS